MKIYTYNNKIMTLDGKWMEQPAQPGPGPGPEPGLPPYTIRLKFTEGVTPTFSRGTAVQVSSSPNIWDLTYENNSWPSMLTYQYDLIDVIGANTASVTNMNSMFEGCEHLATVPLFDTSHVTDMEYMFSQCYALTSIPLFNTSSATNMSNMFSNCYNVQSGALALYQQASTQTTPPIDHMNTFMSCGFSTVTGAAELAQIPADWGGTMS